MKQRMITLTLEGKTEGDLELAFKEVVKLIQAGNTSGRNSNDDGNFSFAVRNEVLKISPADVTEKAKHIAKQCLHLQFNDIEYELRAFAFEKRHSLMGSFENYSPCDVGSMIQCLLNQFDWTEYPADVLLAKALTKFFGVEITFLNEGI